MVTGKETSKVMLTKHRAYLSPPGQKPTLASSKFPFLTIAGRALKTKRLVHKSVVKSAKSLPFLFECCLSAAAQCRHLLCCTAAKSPSGMWMPSRIRKEKKNEGERGETRKWEWANIPSASEQPEIHQLNRYPLEYLYNRARPTSANHYATRKNLMLLI